MSLSASCEAIQAVERLFIYLKEEGDHMDQADFQKCGESLDKLKSVKSSLEGSEVKVAPPKVSEDCLQELKQLTLMHLSSTLKDEVREKFYNLIKKTFRDNDIEILFAVLITCPWYAVTQKERGEQAKHNIIFIVYQSTIERFVAPVNSHTMDETNVVDMDWLYAIELYHFVQFLAKGKARCVDAVYCPKDAIFYQTPQWQKLGTQLQYSKVTGLRGYLEACRGQSLGGIGKKGNNGKFRMKESTTFRQLCDSFRLMHNAYNSVNNLPPCTEEFSPLSVIPSIAHKAIEHLKSMYQNPDASMRDAFQLLCDWKHEIDKVLDPRYPYTKPEEIETILGHWHMELRLQGKTLTPSQCPKDDLSEMMSVLEEVGGPVAKLKPEQILLIARAGSYMYNLSTPTSDTDYVIIYAENTEKYLSSCKWLTGSVENRGPLKQVEYGAYEVRCFGEMLFKGSVVIQELVYTDGHKYMSPAWKALSSQKHRFLSENGIKQYMGLIKNNMKMIEKGKHKDQPQERKLFYQIYHKLDSIDYMMRNIPPPVRCTGPIRDFIMRVRTSPLEGELSRDSLYQDCIKKVNDTRDRLANRTERLRENCDFDFLVDWILTVRGITNNVT